MILNNKSVPRATAPHGAAGPGLWSPLSNEDLGICHPANLVELNLRADIEKNARTSTEKEIKLLFNIFVLLLSVVCPDFIGTL